MFLWSSCLTAADRLKPELHTSFQHFLQVYHARGDFFFQRGNVGLGHAKALRGSRAGKFRVWSPGFSR